VADSFADLLREYRLNAGLTQEELADLASLSPRTLSDLERGIHRAPFRHTVGLLAEALGLTSQQSAVLEASITRARRSRDRQRLSQSDVVPDIPVPETPMIGRSSELQLCLTLLQHNEARLITIAGADGIGKTRLALEIGRIAGIGGGRLVVYVPLEVGLDSARVLREIAGALAIEAEDDNALIDLITLRLRAERTLVILDGFDRALGARLQLLELLERLPGLQFIVTSRQPIGLRVENVVLLEPLRTPAAGAAGDDAVQLFVRAASAMGMPLDLGAQTTPLIGRIVDELRGVPLAIELAASQIDSEGPAAVLAGLQEALASPPPAGGDADGSVGRVLALAQKGLSPEQRRLLHFCALFPGEWSVAHISALDRVSGDAWSAIPNLNGLAQRHLIYRTSGSLAHTTYDMATTIRRVMRAELEALGESGEARNAFAAMVSERLRELLAADLTVEGGFDGLDREERNLALALRRLLESSRESEAVSMLWQARYWVLRRPRPFLDECLDACRLAAGLPGESRLQITALDAAVHIARGRYDEGSGILSGCVREARRLGFDAIALEAIDMTAWCPVMDEEVRTLAEGRVEAARGLGDPARLGHLLTSRATRHLRAGDYAAVEADCGEALALDRWLLPQADPRIILGICYVFEQKLAEARQAFQGLLASVTQPVALASFVFAMMGTISQQLLQEGRAAMEYREGLRFAPQGTSIQPAGICLEGAAWIASRQGQWLDAARLLGAASTITPPSNVQASLELGAKTAALVWPEIPSEYESAVRSGAALSLERAVSLALSYLDSMAGAAG
jgi:DNA-binding XRE family transcriptional regulator